MKAESIKKFLELYQKADDVSDKFRDLGVDMTSIFDIYWSMTEAVLELLPEPVMEEIKWWLFDSQQICQNVLQSSNTMEKK
jgi:hypothetical protein